MQNNKWSRIGLILASSILVGSFILFALEKTQLIDLYKKEVPSPASTETHPVNDIDYSPASSTDNDEINQKKETGEVDKPVVQNTSKSIGITLSAAGQDTKGGPVIVRTILSETSTGTCKLTLTKDSVVKTYQSEVINKGTYYSCNGFDIPFSDLSVGEWNLKLDVINNGSSGTTQQIIKVEAV